MDDLRSLHATCKSMLGPCRDRDISRQLALDRVPIQDMQNTDPEGYDVFVRSLAAAGNPAAGFLAGIDDIFGRNRGLRPPLDELHCTAQAGHRGAAYVAAVVLYRFYSGADADGTAFAYMKQVEGEAPGQWRRWMLNNVHSLYLRTHGVNLATQMRTIALRDGHCRLTLPPEVARGNIQHCIGRTFCSREPSWRGFAMHFCSDECSLCFECDAFFIGVNHVFRG
jgi:hypothetical protein